MLVELPMRAAYDGPMRVVLVAALLLCGACPPPASGTDGTGIDDSTATSPGSSGSSSTGDACDGASDCDTDGICVAEYIPESDGLGGERGPARCESPDLCIQALDLGRWCFEHPSCCEGLRCRDVDGICEVPDFGEGTTGSTGTSSTSTGTTDDTGSTGTGTTDDTGSTGSTGGTDSSTGTDP